MFLNCTSITAGSGLNISRVPSNHSALMLMLHQVRMFRNMAWRNTPSEVVILHQGRAPNTSMLLLRSYGADCISAQRRRRGQKLQGDSTCLLVALQKWLTSFLLMCCSLSRCSGVPGWPTYPLLPCVHQEAGALQAHLLVSLTQRKE